MLTRRFSIQSLLSMVFFAALWGILWWQLSGEWSVNDQYSYGWFVPFFAIILFWLRWEDAPEESKKEKLGSRKQAVAIDVAMIALLLLFPIRLFEIGNPDWRPLSWLHALCVVTITLVFLWSVGGTPCLRHFAFPVAFTLIAVPWISPIEMPIIQGLMRLIAAVAAETANLLGIPAQVQGNLIQVRTGIIGVNEACSGVRSLQTSLMIGLLFGELKRLSIVRRIALVIGAIGIALIANFLRAVFLVWLGADEGMSAIERWHDIAGYGIVALVFVGSMILAGLLGRQRKLESRKAKVENAAESREQREADTTKLESRKAKGENGLNFYFLLSTSYFAAALCWIVFSEFAAAAWYRAHEKNLVAAPRWTVHWPNDAPGFHEFKVDEGVRSTLRYDQAKQAAWNLGSNNGNTVTVAPSAITRCLSFFFRWQPGGSSVVRARAHRPDICLPAAGWRQVADRGVANYSLQDGFVLPFHHMVFADEHGGVTAHTFFCLQEDKLRPNEPRPDLEVSGGAQPDWSFGARSRVVLNGIRNSGQQIVEVVLVSHQLDDAEAETKFAAIAREIIKVETRK